MKKLFLCSAMLIAAACATAPKPEQPAAPQNLHGVASWYGQEFAGRTTANGEIFDPLLFTAAHRTLPFGTVCDVTNPKTGQSVRVRINDRGPYIGGRMIDLSYAAAQQIGLIDPGSGEVDVTVVKLGNGDREAPAPLVVTVPDIKPIPVAAEAPPPSSIPVVVDNVAVVEEHHGVETRLQVAPDGRSLSEVPVKPAAPAPAPAPARQLSSAAAKFFVQVGAFAQEANAKELQTQLAHIGQDAHIDSGPLYKVRIGPFETRDQAIAARGRLENAGMSAIVVPQ
jgi:rare lipoprotein A